MSLGRKVVVGFVLLTTAVAVCQERAATSAFPNNATIVVTGHGVDRPNAICEGFRLSEFQARKFFERSHRITRTELHDHYDYLPCWVEGTLTISGEKSTWKIRPVGVGEIRHKDGTIELRGCKKCDSLFK